MPGQFELVDDKQRAVSDKSTSDNLNGVNEVGNKIMIVLEALQLTDCQNIHNIRCMSLHTVLMSVGAPTPKLLQQAGWSNPCMTLCLVTATEIG